MLSPTTELIQQIADKRGDGFARRFEEAYKNLPDEGYWDTARTAQYTGDAESTLTTLRSRGGGIPFKRFGRSCRYEVRVVRAWCDAKSPFFNNASAELAEETQAEMEALERAKVAAQRRAEEEAWNRED